MDVSKFQNPILLNRNPQNRPQKTFKHRKRRKVRKILSKNQVIHSYF